jgi:VWFA-related protein
LAGAHAVSQQTPSAEKSPHQDESGLVLRVTTRLVQVDTVAVDKDGHPIQGLTANDFTVTENGVRQHITSFSESVPAPVKPRTAPALPPHVATNRPVVMQANAESGTVAVLLLDGLNTPPESQIFCRISPKIPFCCEPR